MVSQKYTVAIPSFIQGISTQIIQKEGKSWGSRVAIPSFIQGISTDEEQKFILEEYDVSQSLLLFRAFQLTLPVAIPSFFYLCRNPFFYSGHFNWEGEDWNEFYMMMSQSLLLFRAFQLSQSHSSLPPYGGESQSLLLFRAFQLLLLYPYMGEGRGVAIPSFIQGISTHDRGSDFSPYLVAIPSFIQGISTLRLEILDR